MAHENYQTLLLALTNQWHDGSWSWWCRKPNGGPQRHTREEAMQDLIEWAKETVKAEPQREAYDRARRRAGEEYRGIIPLKVIE